MTEPKAPWSSQWELVDEDAPHSFGFRDHDGRFWIGNMLTQELQQLPPGRFESWTEDGYSMLARYRDGDSFDVSFIDDFLFWKVFRGVEPHHAASELALRHRGSNNPPMPLPDIKRRRVLRTLALRMLPTRSQCRFQIARFSYHHGGCRIVFCLKGVHEQLGFSQYRQQSSVWANHSLQRIETNLRKIWNLGGGHVHRSKEYSTEHMHARCPDRHLPWHGVSLHGLLCLLLQWSTLEQNFGGMKSAEDRSRASNLLRSLLGCVSDLKVPIGGNLGWIDDYPSCVHGDGYVCVLVVTNGVVDMSALQADADAESEDAAAMLPCVVPDAGEAIDTPTLFELLCRLGQRAGPTHACSTVAHGLARQCLGSIARCIDRTFSAAAVAPNGYTNAMFSISAADGMSRELALQEDIAGYLAAGRISVKASFTVTPGLSFVNDDSTVRSSDLSNTLVALPSNDAIWAPCQVPSDQHVTS